MMSASLTELTHLSISFYKGLELSSKSKLTALEKCLEKA